MLGELEAASLPALGVVAALAICAEAALMSILLLVAAHTLGRCWLVRAFGMARFAAGARVRAKQWKRGYAVIE